MDFKYITEISESTPSKIVLLVIDGLGGLPDPKTGKSELETASLPNLDALAGDILEIIRIHQLHTPTSGLLYDGSGQRMLRELLG